jgi:hypothetical protein
MAALHGRVEMVGYLVGKGLVVQYVSDEGRMAHHGAACNGHLLTLELLVSEAGAPVDARSLRGDIALHLASRQGHLPCVQYLCEEAGADMNVVNNQGKTAEQMASNHGMTEVAEYLRETAPKRCEVWRVLEAGNLQRLMGLLAAMEDEQRRWDMGRRLFKRGVKQGEVEVVRSMLTAPCLKDNPVEPAM